MFWRKNKEIQELKQKLSLMESWVEQLSTSINKLHVDFQEHNHGNIRITKLSDINKKKNETK